MNVRQWLLVVLVLICWAGVAIAWMTSPGPCGAPEHGVVECAR